MTARLKVVVGAVVLLAALMLFLWWASYTCPAAYPIPAVSKDTIEKARKLHGNFPMVGDKITDEIYMIRNGRMIKI